MKESISTAIETGLQQIQRFEFLAQISAVLLALLISRVLLRLVQNQLEKLNVQISKWSIAKGLAFLPSTILVAKRVTWSLLFWMLISASVTVFNDLLWENAILIRIQPFLTIWLVYRIVVEIISVNSTAEKAKKRKRQIFPILILTLVLSAAGLLDDFLALGVQPSEDMLVTIRSLFAGLLIIYFSTIIARQVRSLVRDVIFPKMKMEQALIEIISTVVFYVIVISGVLAGLQVLGIELTTLTWLLGGLSVGLGFGLKELINNFISGFILLFERSVIPGDYVEVDGVRGDVKEVRLRSTIVRTRLNNSDLCVPNGKLLGDTFMNFSSNDAKNRIVIRVRTTYAADPHKVIEVLKEAVKAHPKVISDPHEPFALISGFTDDGFEFAVGLMVASAKGLFAAKGQIHLIIWDAFRKNGIEIPISQQNVRVQHSDLPSGMEFGYNEDNK